MRKYVIAGNWKMNKNLDETVELISNLNKNLETGDINTEVIICPPYTSLEIAKTLVENSKIKLGAQNMHYEPNGAYTGEISADMLKSVGCEYVILGHSERRTIFNEPNDLINKKIKAALDSGLNPIFCIGETLREREQGITNQVVEKQVTEGLAGIMHEQMSKIIIAYEPVWAIGTGKTATPEQTQEVHAFIRTIITNLYNESIAENLTIQYGGSVKPNNAKDLLSQNDIDGALVGGACLDADSFFGIINSA